MKRNWDAGEIIVSQTNSSSETCCQGSENIGRNLDVAERCGQSDLPMSAQNVPSTSVRGNDNLRTQHKENKISRMMGTVLGVFVMSYVPMLVASVLVNNHPTVPRSILNILTLLFWTNAWAKSGL